MPQAVPAPPTEATAPTHTRAHFADDPEPPAEKGPPVPDNESKTRSGQRKRWILGMLADKQTDEVPGTVLLLSKYSTRNIPLGLQHEHPRGRASRRGSQTGEERKRSISTKKTPDGKIILEPQPEDSMNDPLNWPTWRRDAALLSLGFYCLIGGGMTPVLAAGFNQVSQTLHVSYADVARTTGLYMLGLGMGSVVFAPTAILFGKRPVYILSSVLFVVSSIWCAASPNYAHLASARVFQGIAISPVECLPSATIAEIFFLHERAFRIGIYTLLLLGGKNLVPLVSATIIQGLGWRWVFWIIAVVVGFGGVLLVLFVPETFWDRTPRPRGLTRRSNSALRRLSTSRSRNLAPERHPTFQPPKEHWSRSTSKNSSNSREAGLPHRDPHQETLHQQLADSAQCDGTSKENPKSLNLTRPPPPSHSDVPLPPGTDVTKDDPSPPTRHNLVPNHPELKKDEGYVGFQPHQPKQEDAAIPQPGADTATGDVEKQNMTTQRESEPATHGSESTRPSLVSRNTGLSYTTGLRKQPPVPWTKTLKPWNGRLSGASWWRVAIRPGILFAYPSVLWSALVYALSIGWLIVLSESVSKIYANRQSYNFTSFQIGLVYLSPFIGGIVGTAAAGRLSDVVVRFIARHNDGIYEPEYRLVMAIPIAISTAIGLMGFGWSAEEKDAWIVPTLFFGVISFGCSLGSTTSITFCVDSYRQYASEALVTLNFSKNVFHGFIWSLFFPHWLEADGSKKVFVAIGCIQLACMMLTIPMYIYGKRARMWTVRRGMMDRF